jgi:hypothetical protein
MEGQLKVPKKLRISIPQGKPTLRGSRGCKINGRSGLELGEYSGTIRNRVVKCNDTAARLQS